VKKVPLSEVKDDLFHYLREADDQEVIITRHGKPAGVLIGFCGPSGCGKTTLLQMLALLDAPTEGEISFGGVTARSLTPRRRAELRLARIGFVRQSGNLLPQLSAPENVALPHWRLHKSRACALERAAALLDELALSARRDTAANALSIGEAQRVALARALSNGPSLVLAEPTGSLDSANAARVLEASKRCGVSASRCSSLRTTTKWPRAGVAMELLDLFVTKPLEISLLGRPPDLSDFLPLVGNAKLALVALLFAWVLAAFGEELVWRGYLMNRVALLFAGSRAGWTSCLAAFWLCERWPPDRNSLRAGRGTRLEDVE
jgi:prevent-host-death family protein